MKTIIGVVGPGNATPDQLRWAEKIGAHVAEAGHVLLTGGMDGVMRSSSKGAKRAGGLVIGVSSGDSRTGLNSFVDIPILTGIGAARNYVNVLTSTAVIAIG